MDLAAIRADIASALTPLGWNAYAYAPGDITSLPAAIAGVPNEIVAATMTSVLLTMTVTLYVSLADLTDAQHRLDNALSIGVNGSVIDALQALPDPAWKYIRFTGAGNIHPCTIGQATALTADVRLEIQA